jgi:hypothetical protein
VDAATRALPSRPHCPLLIEVNPSMATEDNDATKQVKQVSMRLEPSIYKQLLKAASEESIKRGKQVSVPALCLEIVLSWLSARKK